MTDQPDGPRLSDFPKATWGWYRRRGRVVQGLIAGVLGITLIGSIAGGSEDPRPPQKQVRADAPIEDRLPRASTTVKERITAAVEETTTTVAPTTTEAPTTTTTAPATTTTAAPVKQAAAPAPAPAPRPAPAAAPAAQPAVGTCTASVSDSAPAQNSTVVVSVKSNVPSAGLVATAHYKSKDTVQSGTTNGQGAGSVSFMISRATAGYEVVVDVSISGKASCSTSFTPR